MNRLFHRLPSHRGLATTRTGDYLRWRYGFEKLRYRVVLAGSSTEDGLAVFHLRRRGRAIEATVCDVLVPDGSPGTEHRLMQEIARLDACRLPPAHRPSASDTRVRAAAEGRTDPHRAQHRRTRDPRTSTTSHCRWATSSCSESATCPGLTTASGQAT